MTIQTVFNLNQLSMIQYNNISEIESYKDTILTIGNFDGMHLGHQTLLETVNKLSKENACKSVVLSFYPAPQSVIAPKNFLGHIDIKSEKIEKIKNLDINILLLIKFNKTIMKIKAIDFLKNIIIDKFSPKIIVLGYNHSFGFKREGDFNFLKKYRNKYNYKLIKINEYILGREKISSTNVKNNLKSGEIEIVNQSLKKVFSIQGVVVKGQGVGRKIGFPTANLKISKDKILPKIGVYYIEILLENKIYKGMCNVGKKPTVRNEGRKISIEVYVFNFNRDIYGKTIRLDFLDFLRDEKKFKSIKLLKKQLIIDRNKCLEYCDNNV